VTRDRLKTAASVLIFLLLALSGALPVELKLQDYIQDVLVAVDLYGEPTMPVERAAQLARAAGARLQILYVASPRVHQSTTARLHAVAAGVRSRYGVPVEVDVVAGRPHSAIASRAADAGADLVVLGAHRRSLMRDMFVRPTAERSRHEYPAPILIVNGEPRGAYDRILVPTDFSAPSAEAARATRALFPTASLHYLHVFTGLFESRVALAGDADQIIGYRNGMMLRARQEMERFVEREHLPTPASLLVYHGHRATCIRTAARQLGASLIVLGTSKSRIVAALPGSVTGELVERAPTDLLVLDARAMPLVRRRSQIGARDLGDRYSGDRLEIIA